MCALRSLHGIVMEAKSKKPSPFVETRGALRICANHKHGLFLRNRQGAFPSPSTTCSNPKTKLEACNFAGFSDWPLVQFADGSHFGKAASKTRNQSDVKRCLRKW